METYKNWRREKFSQALIDEFTIQPPVKTKISGVWFNKMNFWIVEHVDGSFSTCASNKNIHGTFEECKQVLIENFPEFNNTMKTTLPKEITTREQAEAFLRALYVNEEDFHPEDDAHDIVWDRCDQVPSEAEKDQLNKLMADIYKIDKFDPCDFLLFLAHEHKQFSDTKGEALTYAQIKTKFEAETPNQLNEAQTWADFVNEAEKGDKFQVQEGQIIERIN